MAETDSFGARASVTLGTAAALAARFRRSRRVFRPGGVFAVTCTAARGRGVIVGCFFVLALSAAFSTAASSVDRRTVIEFVDAVDHHHVADVQPVFHSDRFSLGDGHGDRPTLALLSSARKT